MITATLRKIFHTDEYIQGSFLVLAEKEEAKKFVEDIAEKFSPEVDVYYIGTFSSGVVIGFMLNPSVLRNFVEAVTDPIIPSEPRFEELRTRTLDGETIKLSGALSIDQIDESFQPIASLSDNVWLYKNNNKYYYIYLVDIVS